MRDEISLRKAVIADPENDLSRLAYADCIEENGNADWAWQIRHQVATPDTDYWSVAKCHFNRNDEGIYILNFTTHVFPDWQMPLPESKAEVAVRYRRGFAAGLVCTVAYWAKCWKRIIARHPIQTVHLWDGRAAESILPVRGKPGLFVVTIGKGRHRIELPARLANSESHTLAFQDAFRTKWPRLNWEFEVGYHLIDCGPMIFPSGRLYDGKRSMYYVDLVQAYLNSAGTRDILGNALGLDRATALNPWLPMSVFPDEFNTMVYEEIRAAYVAQRGGSDSTAP